MVGSFEGNSSRQASVRLLCREAGLASCCGPRRVDISTVGPTSKFARAMRTDFGDAKRRRRHHLQLVVVALVLVGACSPTRGCIESDFDLAPESRIPRWFVLHDGAKRSDFSVQLDYWIGPAGRTATITLRSGGRTLDSVVATMKDSEPRTLVPKPATGPIPYPGYEILTARGITEVVEHRRMEPIFYVVDDLQVKRQLGVQ